MRRTWILFVLLACAIAASGCAKPKLELAVASQTNVNPDHSGRPSPVVLKMYELKSDVIFNQADFMSLFENPVQTLGSELVAADELVFVPGEARVVEYSPHEETRFVGVILGFRQMERAHWRTIKPIDPKEKSRFCIELADTAAIQVDEARSKKWDPVEVVQRYHGNAQQAANQAQQTGAQAQQAANQAQRAGSVINNAPVPRTPTQGSMLPAARRI